MAKDSLKINNLNLSAIKDTTFVAEKNQEPIKPIIHYVRKGDTLYSISRKYNVSLDELCKANSLTKNSYINVGQKLIIPNK